MHLGRLRLLNLDYLFVVLLQLALVEEGLLINLVVFRYILGSIYDFI